MEFAAPLEAAPQSIGWPVPASRGLLLAGDSYQ